MTELLDVVIGLLRVLGICAVGLSFVTICLLLPACCRALFAYARLADLQAGQIRQHLRLISEASAPCHNCPPLKPGKMYSLDRQGFVQ